MLLSVIIPCYNESNTIQMIIEAIHNSPYKNKEIIVVDDFSTDDTREKLKVIEESKIVKKVFYHTYNQGKGASIRTGLKAASGDIIIIQDADLEYNPLEYSRLIEPILQNKSDVVFGRCQRLGNIFLTRLSNIFSQLQLTDMETCYKAFRKEVIQSIHIQENRFGFEPEITAKVARLKCRIVEVPISYNRRTLMEGKKSDGGTA